MNGGPGAVRSRTGLLYAAPPGKRRDFIIMEESLAEKCKVSWQVHPPGMKEIGGNYVGKCLRLKKEGERERKRTEVGAVQPRGFNPCRKELYKHEDKIATLRKLKSYSLK